MLVRVSIRRFPKFSCAYHARKSLPRIDTLKYAVDIRIGPKDGISYHYVSCFPHVTYRWESLWLQLPNAMLTSCNAGILIIKTKLPLPNFEIRRAVTVTVTSINALFSHWPFKQTKASCSQCLQGHGLIGSLYFKKWGWYEAFWVYRMCFTIAFHHCYDSELKKAQKRILVKKRTSQSQCAYDCVLRIVKPWC